MSIRVAMELGSARSAAGSATLWRGPALAALMVVPSVVPAVECVVPGSAHPTLRSALDDSACSSVVLAAGVYADFARVSRSLHVSGAGSDATVVQGRVEVAGPVEVSIGGLAIANGCAMAGLRVLGGASVSVRDLKISAAPVVCPAASFVILEDGFEPAAAPAVSSVAAVPQE